MNSRSKGKRGELELAHALTALGCTARRGQQFRGTADSPDVVSDALSEYHLEVKRTERFDLYAAMAQAERECGSKVPVVCHRRSREEWVAVLRLSDFVKLVQSLNYWRDLALHPQWVPPAQQGAAPVPAEEKA